MINIKDLKPSDAGRPVRYTPFAGCDPSQIETGRIKSWNAKLIFVWYHSGDTAAGTKPEYLEFGC